MTTLLTTNDFEKIEERLGSITIWLGILSTQSPQIWHFCAYVVWIIVISFLFVQYIGTIIFKYSDLITTLYIICYFTVDLFLLSSLVDMILYKDDYLKLLDWCKSRHNIECTGIHNFIRYTILTTYRIACKGVRFLTIFIPCDAMLITAGPIITKLIFGNTDWKTPLEIYLPFLTPKDIVSYLTNSILTAVSILMLILCLSVTLAVIWVSICYINCQFLIVIEMLRVQGLFYEGQPPFGKWYPVLAQMHADISQ